MREEAGAPEVTDEMVKAGVSALRGWMENDDRFVGWDGFAVRDVFLRMRRLCRVRFIVVK